ncbi:MAG TPA: heme-binding protein [Thermoanaerobaculia bacterium]|nr:heme-binding protein [Thermoanaerobaculia bacterium]
MKRNHWYTLAGVAAASATIYMIYTRSRASAESAPYELLERDGGFELRDYPELAVARSQGTGEDFGSAFRSLFRFISRGNSSHKKIAMTTPVLIDREGDDVVMDFVMPAGEPVPQPLDSDVTVGRREGGRVAALRFGGFMRAKAERRAIARLRDVLAERGLRAKDDPVIAYYDAPAVPPPFRRNEVLIRVE